MVIGSAAGLGFCCAHHKSRAICIDSHITALVPEPETAAEALLCETQDVGQDAENR